MSADTGPKKRLKDKKRKKGGVDVSVPGPMIVQKDVHPVKLISDENMHVHKETKFGGNIISKLIFVVVLLAIGAALCLSLANKGDSEGGDEENESFWLPDYFNFGSFFSADEPPEPPIDVNDEDETSETKLETSFLESLWSSFPFFRESKPDTDVDEEEANRFSDNESADSKDGSNNAELDEDEPNSLDDDDNESNEEKDDDDDSSNRNDADYDDENDDDDSEKEDEYNKDDDDYNKEDDEYSKDDEFLVDQKGNDRNSDDYEDKSDEEQNEGKKLDDNDDLPYPPDNPHVKYHYFESEDSKDDKDDDEEDSQKYSVDDQDNYFDSEILEQSDPDESRDSTDDLEPDVNTDSEQTATNVVTKLGVGIALMFVAYSVIIRKWEDYEILVPPIVEDEEYELPDDIVNDHNATDQSEYSFNANQLLDEELQNLHKNETTDNYAETPSESESEDISDSVMQWSASNSADILANEISDSELTASDSVDNSDIEAEAYQNQYAPEDYEKSNITNAYDWRFKDELDQADQDFDNRRFTESLEKYEQILHTYPHSARAKFGVAMSLDAKAESLQSNKLLARAIEAYVDALFSPGTPDSLFKAAGERVINRMRFKGDYESCINIQNLLIERFPHSVSYQNDFVVSLLTLNRMQEAKQRLEQILLRWPDNGLALVHYGFVLKLDGDLPAAVLYLSQGILTNESGTQEGRFYFHLGDALQRLGRNAEAVEIYRKGVEKGIFLSEYQRSLYNVERLTGRPWWTVQQTTYGSFFSKLEKNWEIIRDEGVSLLRQRNTTFTEESEQLRENGDWKQFELFSRGVKRSQCDKAPRTCQLVSEFEPAAGCRRGQVKFSVMEPGTHVWPHCGPTNCRLRAHLGLVVPSNVTIRVALETRQWKEGEIFVFDDSFEHEVWHNGSSWRLILIIDVWHPELTKQERRTLASI